MNRKLLVFSVLSIALVIFLMSCKNTKQTSTSNSTQQKEQNSVVQALPPVIIYKMVKDYSNFVPVIMDDHKTKIVSYPAITDIKIASKPTALHDGYWLDNRGISKNVVFLKYTYEEYAKLPQTPTAAELMNQILIKDPLLEIYDCGKRSNYQDLINELNVKIKNYSGKLNEIFTSIK